MMTEQRQKFNTVAKPRNFNLMFANALLKIVTRRIFCRLTK